MNRRIEDAAHAIVNVKVKIIAGAVFFTLALLFMSLSVINVGVYLGFTFSPFIYTLVLASPLFALLLTLASQLVRRRRTPIRITESLGLVLLMSATVVLRLWFAQVTSIFPDEYVIMRILSTYPLSNVGNFLGKYLQIAGRESAHPPLGFLIMSLSYGLNSSIFGARLVSIILGSLSVLVAYFVFREIGFGDGTLLATAVYGLAPFSLVFLSAALTDIFMDFFGLLAVLLYIRSLRDDSVKLTVLSGLVLGLSMWSKQGLPVVWGLMLLLAALTRSRYVARALKKLAPVYILAASVFSVWYFLNPVAFVLGNVQLAQFAVNSLSASLGGLMNSLSASLGGLKIPVPTGPTQGPTQGPTNPSAFPSLFELVMPRLVRATVVPYVSLLLQLPFWFTPVVLMCAVVGLLRSNRRSKADWLFFGWLVVALLVELAPIRDIRYMAFAMIPLGYFAARGLEIESKTLRTYLKALLVVALITFSVLASSVAFQQYYGPTEGIQMLKEYGLENEVILTNAPDAVMYELPRAKVYFIADTLWSIPYNVTQLSKLIQVEGIRTVLYIHSARGLFPQLDERQIEFLRSRFTFHIANGPSDFSWYELLWKPTNRLQYKATGELKCSYHYAGVIEAPASDLSLGKTLRSSRTGILESVGLIPPTMLMPSVWLPNVW